MGIHYTYKAQRGERSLKKQQKQEERQRRSNARKFKKQLDKESNQTLTFPENEIITLDHLTNPDRK